MANLFRKFNQLSISKRIGIALIINLALSALLISITEALQMFQIRYYQQQLPKTFFNEYNQYSLRQIAYGVKKMILSVYDYRVCYLNNLKLLMLSNSSQFINSTQLLQNNPYNKVQCFLTNQNRSIFSCQRDKEIEFAMEQGWALQKRHPLKRVNIIYQNKQNESDIMIRTIYPDYNLSQNAKFQIRNYSRIAQIISNVKLNESTFSPLSKDEYSDITTPISYIRSKLVFPKYNVLLQMQTYANFLSVSLQRVLYSHTANIVVLYKNKNNIKGYNYYASLRPLEADLNYTYLMQYGYKHFTFQNGSIHQSFAIPFSNAYTMGTKTFISNQSINQNFVIIVGSLNFSQKQQERISSFIKNLHVKILQFITVNLVAILIIILTIAYMVIKRIHGVLKLTRLSMRNYMRQQPNPNNNSQRAQHIQKYIKNQVNQSRDKSTSRNALLLISTTDKTKKNKNFMVILNWLMQHNIREQFFHQILRKIYMIIVNLEGKKRTNRKQLHKINYDQYPLNIIDKSFSSNHSLQDYNRFQHLRKQILVIHQQNTHRHYLHKNHPSHENSILHATKSNKFL